MKTRVLGMAAAAVAVAFQFSASAQAAPLTVTPPCGSSFNVYDYTASALSQCGITTAAPRIVGLSGGGTRADYSFSNGSVAHIYDPPAGFDAATAMPAQLAEYGLHAPTSGFASLATWDAQMQHATFEGPPSFMAVLPNTYADSYANVSSSNWAGFVVQTTGVDYVSSSYDEPSFGASRCSSISAVTWEGIGGYGASDPLGQAGTAHNVPDMVNHQAWYEVYPLEPIIPLNLTANKNDYMAVNVWWDASNAQYGGLVYDTITGKSIAWSQTVSPNYYSGDSADAIVERPSINGSYSNLSNFETMTFPISSATVGSTAKTFDQFPHADLRHVNMVNSSGTTLAEASTIGTDGSFTVKQKSCN